MEYQGLARSQLNTTERVMTIEEANRLIKRKRVREFVNGFIYTVLQLICVLYSLFGDDIRHFATGIDNDEVFYILTCICIFFFLADIFLWVYMYDDYLWSSVFWQDFISMVSMIFDLGWMYKRFFESSFIDQQFEAARSAGMYYVGFKYLEYIEVMRYVRLIRIQNFLKFEKYYHEIQGQFKERKERKEIVKLSKKMNKEGLKPQATEHSRLSMFSRQKTFYPTFDEDIYEERVKRNNTSDVVVANTRINNSGKQLSTNNTKRVILIILIMAVTIPVFRYQTYMYPQTAYDAELGIMQSYAETVGNDPTFYEMWNAYITNFDQESRPLLSLTLYRKGRTNSTNAPLLVYRSSANIDESTAFKTIRPYELMTFNEPVDMRGKALDSYFIAAIFDDRKDANLNAGLSILRTFFVMVVLLIFTLLSNRDAKKLILGPLQEMMEKIQRIQVNPCKAAKEEFEMMIKLKEKKKDYWKARELKEKEKYETSVLLSTLVKSGELLAIGLGEAGTEIIVENLNKDGLSATSEGKKVYCIFGFCDIRGFGDVNEVLREDVMKFVNKIALVVHFIVDKYAGSVNKNIGDCFLLVWKFHDNEIEKVFTYDDSGEIKKDIQLKSSKSDVNTITARCELAVLSFIEIILAINKSKSLDLEYNQNPKLQSRIENWKLNMGFGLHMGWAIEGAIGSDHKIDVSYLSPNVNLASRLEAATRQFGLNLLISGQIYYNLSEDIQKMHRAIDVINAKGSKQAMELFTFDMNLKYLERTDLITDKIKEKDFSSDDFNGYMIEYRKKLTQFHDVIFKDNFSTKLLYLDHPDIKEVRKIFTKNFFDRWDEGFKAYRSGDWVTAYKCFTVTYQMIPGYEDGPSRVLSKYMKERDLKPPANWIGVRSLTSK